MSMTDRVLRHFNVANLVLLAAAVLLYIGGVHPLLTADPVRLSLQGLRPLPTSPQAVGQSEAARTADRRVPPVLDYITVSEQNLFHSTRKMPAGGGREEQQALRPDLVLHGTLVADGLEVAYVTDRRAPRTSPGRGERQTILKKGDHVGGYILSEIGADRIVLAKGDDKLVIPLDSPGKKRTVAGPASGPAIPVMVMPQIEFPSPRSAPESKVLRR